MRLIIIKAAPLSLNHLKSFSNHYFRIISLNAFSKSLKNQFQISLNHLKSIANT